MCCRFTMFQKTTSLFEILFMWNIHVFSLSVQNSSQSLGFPPQAPGRSESRSRHPALYLIITGLTICSLRQMFIFAHDNLNVHKLCLTKWSCPFDLPGLQQLSSVLWYCLPMGDPFLEECTLREFWAFLSLHLLSFPQKWSGAERKGDECLSSRISYSTFHLTISMLTLFSCFRMYAD